MFISCSTCLVPNLNVRAFGLQASVTDFQSSGSEFVLLNDCSFESQATDLSVYVVLAIHLTCKSLLLTALFSRLGFTVVFSVSYLSCISILIYSNID